MIPVANQQVAHEVPGACPSRRFPRSWLAMFLISIPAGGAGFGAVPDMVPGTVLEGPASHYLGPDDDRPVNPATGGKVEAAAEPGTMVQGINPTAAMRDVPLGSKVRVTNLTNGRSIVVRVNDRGPYKKGRVIDLTYGAFQKLTRNVSQGVLPRVRVEVVPPSTPTSWPEQKLSVAAVRLNSKRLLASASPGSPSGGATGSRASTVPATFFQFVGISLPIRVYRRP